MMQAEVVDLIVENGRTVGVIAKTPTGERRIRAALTIAADGRHSIVRERASLRVKNLGAPMDVLWMRITRLHSDPVNALGHIAPGNMLVMIERDQYWQCAYLIPKGTLNDLKQRGIENFRNELAKLSPFLGDRVQEIKSWDDVSVLTVTVDRLLEWSKPGLLCIGDAAHAMSPIGGVGINLAIQDAVATANILGRKLLNRNVSHADLMSVQGRRELPTKITQRLQVEIQNRVIRKVLGSQKTIRIPLFMQLLQRWPYLRRIPARMIGMGFRPEHIQTPSQNSGAYRATVPEPQPENSHN
jgi:2-polyprenyl-6-methoxyphenol hydroxylase-like FAD-dependent oxidoreductase